MHLDLERETTIDPKPWRRRFPPAAEGAAREGWVLSEVHRQALRDRFGAKVRFDESMREHTSLRIGGTADAMVLPETAEDLTQLLRWAREERVPVTIVGRGTNLLVRDGGIRGVVANVWAGLKSVRWEEGEEPSVEAGAGVAVPWLVREAARRGLRGIEVLAGVPGSLGGAVAMNAGTRWGEIAPVVERVDCLDEEGEPHAVPRADLSFAYRDAGLPRRWIVVGARLGLVRGSAPELEARVKEILAHRSQSQPLWTANAGSIFKNPKGQSAGRLIEEAGLKGVRVRGAQVSPVHANFIVNTGGATARDVLALVEAIRTRVEALTGLRLDLELKVVGEEEGPEGGKPL